MYRPLFASLVAALLCVAACGDDTVTGEEPVVPAEPFELEIGVLDSDSGDFVPLGPSDTVEIVVGFQGLIFVDLALRAPAEVASRFTANAFVAFTDAPELDYSFRDNFVDFDPGRNGTRICRRFRVPFGQELILIDGQDIELDLALRAAGWDGQTTVGFAIEDAEDCIEAETGELVCEGDT